MALEEKKRRYRADGTAIDEKGDRSVVADVALKDEGVVSNAPVSPTQVAEVPKQVEIKPVTPTPAQNPVTVQESQGGVNPEVAEKKVEQRSSNDGVAPPAELGPLVTTVTPIDDNAPQLRGGTPVEAQNTDAQAQNISGTPEPQNVGTAQKNSQEVNAAQQSTPLFKSDPALQAEYENEVKSWGLNGNVDQLNRPMVSGRDMRKMGWRDFGSPEAQASTATIYTSRWGFNVGGKEHDLVMTPIAADGKVLSPEKLEQYIDYLIANGKTPEGIIALDKKKGNLLVGVDLPNDIEQKIHQAHDKYYLGGGQQNAGTPNGNITTNEGKTPTEETNTTTVPKAEVKETNATPVAEAKEEGATAQVNTAQRNTAMTPDSLGQMNDLFLNQIIEKNVGKDSEAAKKAVQMAREELERRGKPLPPSLTEAPKQEAKKEQPKKGELTDEEKKDKVAARAALSKYNGGNVNMSKRPVVSEERMREAGWVGAIGDTSLYPQMEKVKDSNGKEHKIIITPICADGTILSPDEVKEFVESLDGTDDFLANDTHGIIIKVDGNDDDLNEMDDLIKRAMKGELVTEMTEDEEEKYSRDNDPARKGMVDEAAKLQKQYDDLLAKVNDPNYRPKSVALEASESELKKHNEDTEKIGKRNRTSRIIANIGDILQGFANLAGTWYGANSSKLTSLSGAVGEAQERVMTAREKRAEEMRKSIAKIKDQLKASDDADLKALVKRLDDANARLVKYDADVSKSNRSARQRKELEQYKTKQQNQRRAVEAKVKRDLEKLKSDNRKAEKTHAGEVTKEVNAAKEAGRRGTIGYQEAEKRKTKGTPSYRDLHGGKSGKNGSKKRKSKGTVHG